MVEIVVTFAQRHQSSDHMVARRVSVIERLSLVSMACDSKK